MNSDIKIGDILEYKAHAATPSAILYVTSMHKHDNNIRGLAFSNGNTYTTFWDRAIVEQYIKSCKIVHHKRKSNEF